MMPPARTTPKREQEDKKSGNRLTQDERKTWVSCRLRYHLASTPQLTPCRNRLPLLCSRSPAGSVPLKSS